MDDHAGKPQTIGIWMTTALVVGTIIGSGIFLLPVSLAPLGRNVLIGWLISGVGVLCVVFAMARLSRLGGDGIQANIEREFGPKIAFLVAWAFWVSNWVAQASVAVGTASALSFAGLYFGAKDQVVPVAIGFVVLLTAVNAIGVRAAGGLSLLTVAIKLLPLLAVIWLFLERGASGGTYEPLPTMPITVASVAAATALTFFAFTGFEGATTPVGKVRDPGRTIPRALISGTAFVVVLYLMAGTSIQLLLPASVVAASPAPFADALVSRWGHGVATFAALAIAISAIGCLNGLILATGELGYAMALRGDLPVIMAKTRGINTPVVAQVVGSGLTILILLANSNRATANLFTFMILLSTAAIIALYFASALAAWKLSPTRVARAVIATGLLFLAFATYGIGLEAGLWCLVLLAAGLVVRATMHRLNSIAGSSLVPEAAPAAPLE
ncbi:APC family permease [Sphingomonas sp. G124]|uniref:Arginine/agmatine antiporter n=1 Tax=Sphingomonas cremea TaxID=2904799 RepID=A0A9X1QLP8_9SPHN|nr:amino acid permease [Sphingomonas cremea]MCF2513679.1 APC family permease [Sphingomonas cremea]